MKRIALSMAALALGAGSLAAQHAGQFEAGAFGSFTRYDPAFGLANKIGGGVRLGYLFTDNAVHGGAGIRLFLTNRIALRVEGRALYTPKTQYTSGSTTATHYVG